MILVFNILNTYTPIMCNVYFKISKNDYKPIIINEKNGNDHPW